MARKPTILALNHYNIEGLKGGELRRTQFWLKIIILLCSEASELQEGYTNTMEAGTLLAN